MFAYATSGCNYAPVDDLPSGAWPLPTVPVSFKSMYQSADSPLSFLSVMLKMAPPFLMASLRSASSLRASATQSKAAEEGQASRAYQRQHDPRVLLRAGERTAYLA